MTRSRLACLLVASATVVVACTARPSAGHAGAASAQPDSAEAFGSTRNSRIALAMPAPPAPRPTVVFLAGELSDSERSSLEVLAPNVRIVAGLDRASAMRHAAEAHAVDARLLSAAFIEAAPNLVWVHAGSAGVDRFLAMDRLMKDDRIVLTNSRAVHGPAIADHAFAMLLSLTRGLRERAEDQKAGRWDRDDGSVPAIALQGRTMLVVGIGGIGSEIARRAHGFGMRVIATRRTDSPAPAYVERVGKPEELLALLPEADVVAICVPLTPQTEGLFDGAAFDAMKRGSYLINIARGRIVETDALLGALRGGRLAGACLDVTDPEPLPADHPLWREPRVVITPHVAADADLTRERARALFRENLRRFGAGEPLLNVVDKSAGY